MKKNQNKQVFGLDIGTRSIVGSVGHKEDDKFVVDAICIKEHETRAMLDGQIHDVDRVVETIRQVKEELENQLGYKLKNVCIAAAGRVLKTVTVNIEKEFENEIIIGEDEVYSLEVSAANSAYAKLREELTAEDKSNYYLVGYSPIKYYLNGYAIAKLQGHRSKKVGVELLATFLPAEVIEDLYTAVERVGLEVVNLTLEPIAAIGVSIPEKFRLLNIALVDIGAGTSDICITKDGTINAYGMIPFAGDEITEHISKKYLIDFNEAERIKVKASTVERIAYKDIMGKGHTISRNKFLQELKEGYELIAKSIAEKIIELNGGTATSAVFVVGGGGKVKGFIDLLASYLNIDKSRVALRGDSVLTNVRFVPKGIKKDSTLVTPIGIMLNYYENHSNFVQLTVNDNKVKIFDNKSLTVADLAMFLGWTNEELFSTRGKSLKFTLNNEEVSINGEYGESSSIILNGMIANVKNPIKQDDVIIMRKATKGLKAKRKISELKEFDPIIRFNIDGEELEFMRNVYANGEHVFPDYDIKDGDKIELCNYYTVKSLLEGLGSDEGVIMLDDKILDKETMVREGQVLTFKNHNEDLLEKEEVQEMKIDYDEYVMDNDDIENKYMTEVEETKFSDVNNIDVVENEAIDENGFRQIHVDVNGKTVTLSNKNDYVFVDILDVYPFDTSVVNGETLVMNVNKEKANFSTRIKDKDELELY